MIKEEVKKQLKILWNYMILNMDIPKCDLILGCGCHDLDIPVRAAELFKKGYGETILFSGGLGKLTDGTFKKTEAEIYREIAIKSGVPKEQIYIENHSTNTGDNFRFSKKIIDEFNIKSQKIIIVHNSLSERRTYLTAKEILNQKHLYITSPQISFDSFITKIEKEERNVDDIISVMVGDIQRIIIYPSFGWSMKQELPKEVIKAYEILKEKGFTKYIYTKEQIQNLVNQYGLKENENPNYFS